MVTSEAKISAISTVTVGSTIARMMLLATDLRKVASSSILT